MGMNRQNLSKMQDTKWHVGYVTKAPDDPRRDKRRCTYYVNGMCHGSVRCPGSSHCRDYQERGTSRFEEFTDLDFDKAERGDRIICLKTEVRGHVVDKGIFSRNGYHVKYIAVRYDTKPGKKYKYVYPQEINEQQIRLIENPDY